VLDLLVESTTYDVKGMDQVPHVDVSGTFDSNDKSISMFLLNRDLSNSPEVEILWEDAAPAKGADLVRAHRERFEGLEQLRGAAACRTGAIGEAGSEWQSDTTGIAGTLLHRHPMVSVRSLSKERR
jgi:hypothetical protein